MTELTDLSETDASNTTITTANIAEGCPPSGINNAIRNTLGLIRRAFKASIFRVRDTTDQTKLLAFDLSGLTTATTRTVTMGDADVTLRPQAWEDLGEVTASGSSSLVKGSLSAYKTLRITGLLRPDTANQLILLQTSTDAGSSYASTSGDYAVQYIRAQGATVEAAGNSTQTGCLVTGTSVGSGANEGVAFEIIIHEFNVAAWMRMEGKTTARIGVGTIYHETNSSLRLNTTARNALRIISASGNITGYARFEGIRG